MSGKTSARCTGASKIRSGRSRWNTWHSAMTWHAPQVGDGMYHAHWGLRRSPFAGARTPLFYEGESQAEALARLAVHRAPRRPTRRAARRAAASGKSLALRQFAEQLRREGRRRRRGEPRRDFVARAAVADRGRAVVAGAAARRRRGAAVPPAGRLCRGAQWRKPTRRCCCWTTPIRRGPTCARAAAAAGPAAATRAVDDAHPDRDARSGARGWAPSCSTRSTCGSTWSRGARPTRSATCSTPLVEAGCDRPVVRGRSRSSALYALTDGVPRQVNRLADHALLGAAAEGLEMVDAGDDRSGARRHQLDGASA